MMISNKSKIKIPKIDKKVIIQRLKLNEQLIGQNRTGREDIYVQQFSNHWTIIFVFFLLIISNQVQNTNLSST